ncbi:hypothetical protein [Roseomonas sp. AR75]|uniref:hypothetical protein n=1 Tax=Roseomonas sp. AR75 TaxID=2562311 RepID=UPI0010C05255|nr:hypothetical protein [Roseomonas sp. AR75]
MSDNHGLAAALSTISADVRETIRNEVAEARKAGRSSAWLPILGSLLAALIGAASSYVAATEQARTQLAKLREDTASRIAELELQGRQASDLTAYQKLFDSVLSAADQEKLRRALAVVVLAQLVDGDRRTGLCRFLVTANLDAQPGADDPEPTDRQCRQSAARLLGVAPAQTSAASAISGAIAEQVAGALPVGRGVEREVVELIEDLGAESAQKRLNAAQKLGEMLNGSRPAPERLDVFRALVATTDPAVFSRLTPNGRYNIFVVLSEIRPFLRAMAGTDALRLPFMEQAAQLRVNARDVLEEAAKTPELAGAATRRQIQQTIDRLGQ